MTPEQAARLAIADPSKRDRQTLDLIARNPTASKAVLLGVPELRDDNLIKAACVPSQYHLADILFLQRPDLHRHPIVARFVQDGSRHREQFAKELTKDARMDASAAAARLLAQYPELKRNLRT